MAGVPSHPAMARSRANKKRVRLQIYFVLVQIVSLQLVKMFAVVVTIFMVCWAPYHIYFIYSYHEPSITKIPYINHIYLGFYWLAMSNTCVNPIIYYWMNNRFRAYFNTILFCIPRYLTRAASGSWQLNDYSSPAKIVRSRSCPAESRQNIPIRSIHLNTSNSSTSKPSNRLYGVEACSCYSLRSSESIQTRASVGSRNSVLKSMIICEEKF